MNLGIGFWLGGLIVLAGVTALSMGAEAAAQLRQAAGLLAFGVFEMLLGGALIWGDLTEERTGCDKR